MNYEIKIPEFEGPLDLLLHLIKQDDIDIFDLSIERITKQYLDYINLMEKMNLDIASEYLVMASELIQMKSDSLLPSNNSSEDEYEEDPKEKLIQRLLEYEKYKQMTSTFQELENIRKNVYTRETGELLNYREDEDIDYGVDISDLINAFQSFLDRKELEKPLNTKVEKKEYSVSKRCGEIKDIIKKKKKVKFYDLFNVLTKDYVVVTFLAILSMAKKHDIEIIQDNNSKDIVIKERDKK